MERNMYVPDTLPLLDINQEEYINNKGTTINHFYEKLFSLKNMMNTNRAKEIAEKEISLCINILRNFWMKGQGYR